MLRHIPFFLPPLLLLTACDSRAPESARVEETSRDSPEILAAVERIVGQSRALTMQETFADCAGATRTKLVRKPFELELPKGSWVPPLVTVETTGTLVHVWDLKEAPRDVLIADDGTVVFAKAGEGEEAGTWAVSGEGKTRRFASIIGALQWNADGTELLISGAQGHSVYSWPDMEAGRGNLPQIEGGVLRFAPDGVGFWHITPQELLLGADDPIRISVQVIGVETSGTLETVLPLAKVDTLPPIGKAWGHRRRLYQLDPTPAALVELTSELKVADALTTPGLAVDLAPQAARDGSLVFLRARRRGGSSSRAWLLDETGQRRITGEWTRHIAISPNGRLIAAVVNRGAQSMLLRGDRLAFEGQDLDAALDSEDAFLLAAGQVLEDLRAAYLRSPQGLALQPMEFEDTSTAPPDATLMDTMDLALRMSLMERLGLELSEDFRALGELDDLLDALDGAWPEEAATVAALAAVYGKTLAQATDVHWELQDADPAMGYAGGEFSWSDGGRRTLHTPFYVVRERLSGDPIRLEDVAAQLLREEVRPVLLVEIASERTAQSLEERELAAVESLSAGEAAALHRAALASAEATDGQLERAAEHFADVENDLALAASARFILAERRPADVKALTALARALSLLAQDRAAGMLLEQAEQLAAEDPKMLLEVARGWFEAGELERSRLALRAAEAVDCTKAYQFAILSELATILEFQQEELQ